MKIYQFRLFDFSNSIVFAIVRDFPSDVYLHVIFIIVI